MFKKSFFAALVLFGLVFSQMAVECFADAASELEQAETYKKNGDYDQAEVIYEMVVQSYPGTDYALEAQKQLTILYIDWDKQPQADASLQELVTSFSENEHAAEAVYEIAQKYRWLRRYNNASEVYETVVDNWPDNNRYAMASQIGVARSNIELGNDTAADAAIGKLITDFSDHQDVVKAVSLIAHHCRKIGRHDKASEVYQIVADNWPEHDHAMWSQVGVVRSNIDLNNNTAANTAIEELVTGFSSEPNITWAVFNIAYQYHQYGQHIIENWPGTKHAMWAEAGRAMSKVDGGDDTAANATIAKLLDDFSSHPDLPFVISRGFAEHYYTKAFQLQNQGFTDPNSQSGNQDLAEQVRDNLQKAAVIWEIVINVFPGSDARLEACWWAGNSYRKLGEYEKSIQCYQRIVDNYPDYHLAWHVLFLVGHNYEKLVKSGLISKSEAEPKIRAAYEQLLETYPDCEAAKHARRWLSRHGSK